MSGRLFTSSTLVVLCLAPWMARDARAQERPTPLNLSAAVENAVAAPAIAAPDQFAYPIAPPQKRIDPMMSSLYVSTALLQGLDIHSTMKALDNGAIEANPLMKGVTRNKAAFIAMKAGIAAGTIFAAHKASKKNRVAAIVSLVAINSVYAMVVNQNYKVASGR
ncbi:MAG TPA: DUF5658 family protein [Vicinamibacterales bacterium]|nr:DUF5658 family protein [Vicinamibacterales bacterium]